jgi:hypothetical protein
MTFFCAFVFVAVASGQVGEQQVRRFGEVGRSLSEREIAQIADLANAAGKPAWLVLGFPSMISGVTTITVYLHPDVTTERLRRGRLLRLVADTDAAPAISRRSDWKLTDTISYAYVPLETSTDEIAGERDLAWPFAVLGHIDDETLISLVTFVRSRPSLPDIPEGAAPRQVPNAPLSGVWRQGDQFVVALRLRGDAETFGVTVIRSGERWLVTKWNWSIV